MNIAFQPHSNPEWAGGVITFQDLFHALEQLEGERPEIVLVQWRGQTDQEANPLIPFATRTILADYPRPTPPVARSLRRSFRTTLSRYLGIQTRSDNGMDTGDTLARNGINCSFSVVVEHRQDFSVPLIVWLHDFQHLKLAEMFSEQEIAERNATIIRECQHATLLLAKSGAVAEDAAAFAPSYAHQVRTLRWVSHIPVSAYQTAPQDVCGLYHLPARFFYLPNQFWKHKNHLCVVEALGYLAGRGVHPVVVCTGNIDDYRHPKYFGELLQRLSKWNLREQFIILNQVPRADVFSLMRQSIVVLNPSLFEGFGLSVAEAISLGKRALLSDLPVLREHESPNALYFHPGDPVDLADKMEMLWKSVPPGPDLEMEAEARARLRHRQRAFANGFLEIARESISQFQNQ